MLSETEGDRVVTDHGYGRLATTTHVTFGSCLEIQFVRVESDILELITLYGWFPCSFYSSVSHSDSITFEVESSPISEYKP